MCIRDRSYPFSLVQGFVDLVSVDLFYPVLFVVDLSVVGLCLSSPDLSLIHISEPTRPY